MTENQRVKTIRKALSLSQENFGTPIGLTQSAIAVLETGKTKVTEQTKLLLIHIFKVRKDWFDSEEGEMFSGEINTMSEPNTGYMRNNQELIKEIDFWKVKYFEVNEKYTALLESQVNNQTNNDKRNTG